MEGVDPNVCARYIEYLIAERDEDSKYFHDRLAALYLRMTLAAKKKGDLGEQHGTFHGTVNITFL
jgi:Vam6/Vps39-like protein vacuolar protein sorting-associated protein 39